MYYELYIDVFFLENFMMDSLLLYLINRILKCGRSAGRMTAGAALGSLLTCLILMLSVPGICRLILFHTAAGPVMLAAGLGIRSVPQFVKAYALLYICAVFLGGLLGMLRPCMRAAGIFYGAAVLAYFVFLKCWKLLAGLHGNAEKMIRVSLYTDQGSLDIRALLDTGNMLRDFATGDPVSVIGPETARKIPGMQLMQGKSRLIPYRCVGGDSLMRVFRISRMCVHMDEDCWIEHPLLGIGETDYSGTEGGYEMILNPAVIME